LSQLTSHTQMYTFFWAELSAISVSGVGSFAVILAVEPFRNEMPNNSLVL
jgi:hypothetical protein